MSGEKDKWHFTKLTHAKQPWRWSRIASNGQIVGASTESYTHYLDCVENAKRNGFDPDSSQSETFNE